MANWDNEQKEVTKNESKLIHIDFGSKLVRVGAVKELKLNPC